jgi:hypothetical protein
MAEILSGSEFADKHKAVVVINKKNQGQAGNACPLLVKIPAKNDKYKPFCIFKTKYKKNKTYETGKF